MRDGEPFPPDVESLPNQVRKEHTQEAVITAQTNIDCSQSENAPLQEFLAACCELHPRAWCRSADLWEAYQWWRETSQERYPLSRRAFITQLKRHGCRADRTMSAQIWRGIAIVKKGP